MLPCRHLSDNIYKGVEGRLLRVPQSVFFFSLKSLGRHANSEPQLGSVSSLEKSRKRKQGWDARPLPTPARRVVLSTLSPNNSRGSQWGREGVTFDGLRLKYVVLTVDD